MDYQELIQVWQASDMEVEEKVTLNRKLVKEVAFKKIRSGLYEIKWTAFINYAVGFFWTIFLFRFSFEHLMEIKFFLPALILLGISIYSLILEGRKLYLYYSINSDDSVLETQRKLANLSYLQLKDANSLYILIPLFSGPFFIVTAKALLNFDLYILPFFTKALIYYSLGSLVVAGILVFFITTFPNKKLREAQDFLEELQEEE